MGKPKIIGRNPYTGKSVYEERPFHSKPVRGGYHVDCKRCRTVTVTERLPHDVATDHRCLYNPGEIDNG